MDDFSPASTVIFLAVGTAVIAVSLLPLIAPGPRPDSAESMDFWEAAGRGLVTAAVVNETYTREGQMVTLPVGIRVDNAADVPVSVAEEALLMSPHPLQSPTPDPFRTTQDAALTVQTIPAGGSLEYSYGEETLRGFLPGPAWWCSEEFQVTQGGIAFRIGGETLPYALRPVTANRHYDGPDDNTQADVWTYLRSYPTVVVGKEPLWTELRGTAGERVHVTLDATNIAVYTYDDAFTGDVNVTHGVLTDEVLAGWTVEEGSYSVAPDKIVHHADGSSTLRWFVDIPAALESQSEDPRYPSNYVTVTRSYTLVSPALDAGSVKLPRAESDIDGDGTADAASAAPTIEVAPVGAPHADAGGPYAGREGDTIPLNASGSSDPDGDALQFRWDFTGDGVFDTTWSANPVAEARYTDDFSGVAVVQVSDGTHVASAEAAVTIANVPPDIEHLDAVAQAAFRIEMAGEKWHDLSFTLSNESGIVASVDLVRRPGNPLAQSVTTDLLTFSLGDHATAKLTYTPDDDAVNGQPMGDNPAWIVVLLPDGQEVRVVHNFNAQRTATWTWSSEDLTAFFLRVGVTFRAALHDAGSDDLIANWDFGDGSSATQTFYNNGLSPDPPQSQGGVAPFDVTAVAVHAWTTPGPFVVTLTVNDDDGGAATVTLTVGES